MKKQQIQGQTKISAQYPPPHFGSGKTALQIRRATSPKGRPQLAAAPQAIFTHRFNDHFV